jgi:DNA-binding NarL/FixJ family response regulator
MIGVLVVDDYALMRKTLRAVLEVQPALKLVGEAADGTAAIQLTQRRISFQSLTGNYRSNFCHHETY